MALPAAAVKALCERVVQELARFHQADPQALGAEIEPQRRQLAPALAAPAFLALLQELAHERKVEIAGSRVRLPQHVSTANPRDEKTWQTIKPLLDAAGANVPSVRELAECARVSESDLRDFLHRKSRTGDPIRLTPERFAARVTLARLAAAARDLSSAPGGRFTAAQYRDRIGTGRGLAIEILECLDRLGITVRMGDTRRYAKDFEPILGTACANAGETKASLAPLHRPAVQPRSFRKR